MEPKPPFTASATLYDIIYQPMIDYPFFADRIVSMIEARVPDAQAVLEVGCGTGLYLAELARRFDVNGLDASEEMLAVARTRVPDVTLHHADMRGFALGRRFDAVVCMFSSIGYMTDLDSLASAYRSFRGHLEVGGVAVVEPWFPPETWEEGRVSHDVYETEDGLVVRVNRAGRDGNTSTMDSHHLASLHGGPIEYFVERHVMGLFTRDEHLAAFGEAGFSVEHDPEGFIGRGLFVATAL